jgi:putative zinc- or iron-chelating protein
MPLDDTADVLANALRALDRRQRETREALSTLTAKLDALIDVLAAKQVIGEHNRKHIERSSTNGASDKPRVRLQQYVPDKYNMTHGAPVDCAERMPLCKARCCTYAMILGEQDITEGVLKWDLNDPYVLPRDADGRCTYQDRATGACTTYETRPAGCRTYSCKDDKRIWIDFDAKIPAPPRVIDDEPR